MKIFVVGAHGQMGRLAVAKLAEAGHEVYAGVRNPETQQTETAENLHYISFDLTESIPKMIEAFTGIDQIIFAAGSRGRSLLQVDLDGAVKTMIAAETAGVERYLLVSAANADNRNHWPASMLDYYIAKHYADEWLKNQTNLVYTIIQPVTLTNNPGTGNISLNRPMVNAHGNVSREDVASLLTALVDHPLPHETIVVSGGTVAINDAIQRL